MDRMDELIRVLNEHSYNYYVLDNPTISDKEYDKLYDELVLLEKNQGVVKDNSPTRRVGGEPLSAFDSYTHKHRLYSLDKAQSIDALNEWLNKTEKAVGKSQYSIEYKFDGLTMNLSYQGGKFVRATTRGNGIVGEDVTRQVLTIKTFPLEIEYKGELEVVGEGLMFLSTLKKYNETVETPLKNARNAVAGAIRNLDPKETARRSPQIIFYAVNFIEDDKLIKSQEDVIAFLKKNKFKTSPYFKITDSLNEIREAIEYIGGNRDKLDFLIDGVVLKVNSYNKREELGYTEKFPKWAVAYKFEAEETTTELKDVIWQVGRTGKLTPLAILEPVELCGVTVSKATLNNYGDILRKRVKIGDRVFIRRSNDVIPEITGQAESFDNSKEIEKIDTCPSCGAKLVEKGAHIFCPNELNCPMQVKLRISHFASKNAMDIDGFSEMTAEKFYTTLNVKVPYQLYHLASTDLAKIEGFKDKKIANFLKSVEKARTVTFDRFIFALGILNVGQKTAKDLAANFSDINDLKTATRERLIGIDEIGDVVADSILEFFSDPFEKDNLEKLLKEVTIDYGKKVAVDGIFSGEKVVLTGSLKSYSRSEAAKIIESLGGETLSAVTKNTTLVIVGEDAGLKLAKAQNLKIKIIDEEQFKSMIK